MGDRPTSNREWREKLLVDPDAVDMAFRRWFKHAEDVMRQATETLTTLDVAIVKLPDGFDRLTYLIASVCDIGPYTIDPTPLTDFLRIAQHCEIEDVSLVYEHTIDDLGKACDRVVPVANRLVTAMIANAGLEDSGPPFAPTLIPNANDPRDEWMYSERMAGKSPEAIMLNLNELHEEWRQITTPQGIGRAIDAYCKRKKLPLIRAKQTETN